MRKPLSSATIQKACKVAALQARINLPNITPHTLRHSYATGMLEAGVDLLTISKLLGHSSFVTTMVYLHCRRPHLERAPSPIDWLPIRQCPKWIDPTQPPNQQPPEQPLALKPQPKSPQPQPQGQRAPKAQNRPRSN